MARVIQYAYENDLNLVVFPHFNNTLKKHFRSMGLMQLKAGRGRFQIKYGWGKEYFTAKKEILEKITLKNSYFVTLQGDAGL